MTDTMKTRRQYITPKLTVVSFKTEHGYALSGETLGNPLDGFIELMMPEEGNSYHETETFNQRTGWGRSDNSFWD